MYRPVKGPFNAAHSVTYQALQTSGPDRSGGQVRGLAYGGWACRDPGLLDNTKKIADLIADLTARLPIAFTVAAPGDTLPPILVPRSILEPSPREKAIDEAPYLVKSQPSLRQQVYRLAREYSRIVCMNGGEDETCG
jgi:hypothetical protein